MRDSRRGADRSGRSSLALSCTASTDDASRQRAKRSPDSRTSRATRCRSFPTIPQGTARRAPRPVRPPTAARGPLEATPPERSTTAISPPPALNDAQALGVDVSRTRAKVGQLSAPAAQRLRGFVWLGGCFIDDEPDAGRCPPQMKTRSDLGKSRDLGPPTFLVSCKVDHFKLFAATANGDDWYEVPPDELHLEFERRRATNIRTTCCSPGGTRTAGRRAGSPARPSSRTGWQSRTPAEGSNSRSKSWREQVEFRPREAVRLSNCGRR
jgi:hypothetical protein